MRPDVLHSMLSPGNETGVLGLARIVLIGVKLSTGGELWESDFDMLCWRGKA